MCTVPGLGTSDGYFITQFHPGHRENRSTVGGGQGKLVLLVVVLAKFQCHWGGGNQNEEIMSLPENYVTTLGALICTASFSPKPWLACFAIYERPDASRLGE